jgi:hypothetical protein
MQLSRNTIYSLILHATGIAMYIKNKSLRDQILARLHEAVCLLDKKDYITAQRIEREEYTNICNALEADGNTFHQLVQIVDDPNIEKFLTQELLRIGADLSAIAEETRNYVTFIMEEDVVETLPESYINTRFSGEA